MNAPTPRVSVVMPARNAAPFIAAAIGSVLTQTVRDLELVVVDDGSSDATAAIARSFGDERVRVVDGPARGVAAARNAGIEAATSPWLAFCDADDILLPPHLEALFAVSPPASGTDDFIVTANAYWLFEGGIDHRKTRHLGRFPAVDAQRQAILESNFVCTMTLFPRSVVERVGPFSEDLTHAEDWEFWMRAVFAGVPVLHQPRPHALYRWGTGLSSDRAAMDAGVHEVLRRALTNLPLTSSERAYVKRRLDGPSPQALTRDADEAVRAGRWSEAADAFGRAAALVPSQTPLVWKARLLRLLPPVTGRLLRLQMQAADARRGTTEGRQR